MHTVGSLRAFHIPCLENMVRSINKQLNRALIDDEEVSIPLNSYGDSLHPSNALGEESHF